MSAPASSAPTDALEVRDGLPSAFRYLEPTYPRPGWSTANLHPIAQHWLEIHGWFRDQMAELGELGGLLREGRVDAGGYRGEAAPRVRQLLSNLHHHHSIESAHAFPALMAVEPRMADGFALLDRDHDAIERLMDGMRQAANDLSRGEPAALSALAEALTDQVDRATALIGRHLWDEEEIVVPVLNLRGDQVIL